MSIVQNNIIRDALVIRAAIRQTLFHQNVLRGNSSKFNNIKLFRYMVIGTYVHR